MIKQITEDSEHVVQVAGNASISYGLAFSEVKELVNLFLAENLPKLRQEAMDAAAKNVCNLLCILETDLTKVFQSIDQQKFADPDVQGSINDAVLATAKGGSRSHPEILADLILERAKAMTDDFVSLVARESIIIVPKLTAPQISFLSLVTFLRRMRVMTATSIQHIEMFTASAMPAFEAGYGLSDANKMHLQFAGCANIINIFANNEIENWKQTYPLLSEMSNEALVSHIETNFPCMNKLRLSSETDKIAQFTLTSVGQMIGLVHLSRFLGPLDYKIWLN